MARHRQWDCLLGYLRQVHQRYLGFIKGIYPNPRLTARAAQSHAEEADRQDAELAVQRARDELDRRVYEVQEEDLGALPEPERDPAAPRTPDEEAADARLEQAFRLVRAMSGKAEARAQSTLTQPITLHLARGAAGRPVATRGLRGRLSLRA